MSNQRKSPKKQTLCTAAIPHFFNQEFSSNVKYIISESFNPAREHIHKAYGCLSSEIINRIAMKVCSELQSFLIQYFRRVWGFAGNNLTNMLASVQLLPGMGVRASKIIGEVRDSSLSSRTQDPRKPHSSMSSVPRNLAKSERYVQSSTQTESSNDRHNFGCQVDLIGKPKRTIKIDRSTHLFTQPNDQEDLSKTIRLKSMIEEGGSGKSVQNMLLKPSTADGRFRKTKSIFQQLNRAEMDTSFIEAKSQKLMTSVYPTFKSTRASFYFQNKTRRGSCYVKNKGANGMPKEISSVMLCDNSKQP